MNEIEPGRRNCPIPTCGGVNTLNVTHEGDRLLLRCHKCHAGFEDLLEALNLEPEHQSGREESPHARQERAAAEKEKYRKAAIKALQKWNSARPADPMHPYFINKQIEPHGIRQASDGKLLIYLQNQKGEIVSLQTIDRDGQKRFLQGGEINGCHWYVNNEKPQEGAIIRITEGVATGGTVKDAVGAGHCVVVAFNADNMPKVAKVIRASYPRAEIVICADDDRFRKDGTLKDNTERNAGMEAGKAAARAIGGKLCSPIFKNGKKGETDLNDLFCKEGLDVVRQQIEAAIYPEPEVDEPEELEDEEEKIDSLIPDQAIYCLPPSLREVVKTLEDCSQTPPDIISLALITFTVPFLQGTVLKKTEDDPGRPVRFMATAVGPSGCGKTTTIERLSPLYRDLESEVRDENKERIKTIHYLHAKLKKEKDPFKIADLQSKIDENKPRHKIYSGKTGTRQGYCRAFADGSTPFINLDEIGRTIKKADRGGPDADFIDMLTEIADAGSIRPPMIKGTVDQGPTETIYDLSCSMFGTTTLEDLPQKKAANLLRGGFFSRQIIGMIDEVRGFPEKNYLTTYEMENLKSWRNSIMDACRAAEYSFILDDQAVEVFREYRTTVSKKFVISGNSHEHHAGQIIRRVKQAEDICLIFHCCDGDTNRNKYTSGSTATMATLFVDYFHERHHPKFLRFIEKGEEATTRRAIGDRILKYLKRHDGSARLRELCRNLSLRKKVAVSIIVHLTGQGLVSYEKKIVSII